MVDVISTFSGTSLRQRAEQITVHVSQTECSGFAQCAAAPPDCSSAGLEGPTSRVAKLGGCCIFRKCGTVKMQLSGASDRQIIRMTGGRDAFRKRQIRPNRQRSISNADTPAILA